MTNRIQNSIHVNTKRICVEHYSSSALILVAYNIHTEYMLYIQQQRKYATGGRGLRVKRVWIVHVDVVRVGVARGQDFAGDFDCG